MATQILARGARRSAAPTYTRTDPNRSQALVADPDLLRKQIFDTTTQGVVGDSYAGNSVAEAFGRGSFTETGGGKSQSGSSTGTASPNAAGIARGVGYGLSALGALTGNPNAAGIGGMIGFGGNVAGMNPNQALGAFGQLGASIAGVPGGVVSLGRAAMQGNIAMGIDSALSLANPALGAINSLAGFLGIGTIGGFADAGIAKAAIKAAESKPENESRGYGVGFGDNSFGGYGVNGTGSFRGGSNSDRGGGNHGGGGYGGGIGQSGGNAAGVGSAQA